MAWIYIAVMLFSLMAMIVLMAALGKDHAQRQRKAQKRRPLLEEIPDADGIGVTRRRTAYIEPGTPAAREPEEQEYRQKKHRFLGMKICCVIVWLLAAAAMIVYIIK